MLRTDHVALPVSDMDEAIKFYVEKLGLPLLSREVDPVQQEEFTFLALEGGNLELLKSLAHPFEKPQLKPPYCPHLALATEDMTATLKLIEEQHLPIVTGPLKIEDKVTWLYIADPDNNVIEFVQWLAQ
ncbi:lactoylglutathione lyase [Thermoflexales bacterium]|jgi:catechol 2,3-dioxygenase-like lactoylglutathione lyase family enzyme|nr:lactoylglutathione lyase [Thermoflexales bacterium]